ncbi:MAG: pentapeptide repeat-containing protein [Methyloglobulus sp.]|nr:pentapeptide repeat-containing protein [Methyloglobulus sp.]
MYNASLQGANLARIKLHGASLDSANLQGVNFTGAELQQSSLSSAQMQNANFFSAQLQSVVLSHSQMQSANLINAKLQNASLWYTQLQGANLTVAQLQNANLVQAQLQGAVLINTELQAAHLYSSNLNGIIIQDIDLRGTEDVPDASVFGIKGANNIVSNKKLIWSLIEEDANYVADLQERENYLARMRQIEKTIPTDEAIQKLKHNPTAIADSALAGFIGLCGYTSIRDKVSALQGFRISYRMLIRGIPELESTISVKNNPNYVPLLTDIDRKLCTLPECADIRDDIDGLNCQPFLKESRKINK